MERNLDSDAAPPRRTVDRRLGPLIAAFGFAFQGLAYLLRTQRNAQIHCLVGACAVALGAVLQIARWEWLVLVLTITLVLAAEGVNTAIEATVDLATTARHPLAKIAKDVAAGTVLLCALGAVVVGCLIFLPHLLPMLTRLL
ncbi:MAG: diacylglycerol kinase family protein [Chloroflexi bacterium]|nr:diacylglycerol kinase family protein [Chloroflexota bacterium]